MILHHLLLADLARIVKHLPVGAFWDEDPGKVAIQVAVEWLATSHFRILLNMLLELRNQKSGCLASLLLTIAIWCLTECSHLTTQVVHSLTS